MGGLMSITGQPGQGPVRAGIPVADLTAGLFCAQGILVALLEREASGKGQWVQTSLLQAMTAMLDFQAVRWLVDGVVPPQAGNNHPTSIPTGVFKTADGHINIAASGDVIYGRLCEAVGAPELASDERFATGEARSDNRDALNAALEDRLQHKTCDEWIAILNEAGVPCGPINTIDKVFGDPQVQHLNMAQAVESRELGRLELVGQPVGLSRTPTRLRTAAPEAGEHTNAVLRELLGLDDAELKRLHEQEVV